MIGKSQKLMLTNLITNDNIIYEQLFIYRRYKMEEHDNCCCNELHNENIEKSLEKIGDEDTILFMAEFFKILGDSTRVKILFLLLYEELCVCDIAEAMKMQQSAISHQLRILKQARLVKYRKSGKSAFYSLNDSHVEMIFKMGLEHINERR